MSGSDAIRARQEMLVREGYALTVDGLDGEATQRAWREYQGKREERAKSEQRRMEAEARATEQAQAAERSKAEAEGERARAETERAKAAAAKATADAEAAKARAAETAAKAEQDKRDADAARGKLSGPITAAAIATGLVGGKLAAGKIERDHAKSIAGKNEKLKAAGADIQKLVDKAVRQKGAARTATLKQVAGRVRAVDIAGLAKGKGSLGGPLAAFLIADGIASRILASHEDPGFARDIFNEAGAAFLSGGASVLGARLQDRAQPKNLLDAKALGSIEAGRNAARTQLKPVKGEGLLPSARDALVGPPPKPSRSKPTAISTAPRIASPKLAKALGYSAAIAGGIGLIATWTASRADAATPGGSASTGNAAADIALAAITAGGLAVAEGSRLRGYANPVVQAAAQEARQRNAAARATSKEQLVAQAKALGVPVKAKSTTAQIEAQIAQHVQTQAANARRAELIKPEASPKPVAATPTPTSTPPAAQKAVTAPKAPAVAPTTAAKGVVSAEAKALTKLSGKLGFGLAALGFLSGAAEIFSKAKNEGLAAGGKELLRQVDPTGGVAERLLSAAEQASEKGSTESSLKALAKEQAAEKKNLPALIGPDALAREAALAGPGNVPSAAGIPSGLDHLVEAQMGLVSEGQARLGAAVLAGNNGLDGFQTGFTPPELLSAQRLDAQRLAGEFAMQANARERAPEGPSAPSRGDLTLDQGSGPDRREGFGNAANQAAAQLARLQKGR